MKIALILNDDFSMWRFRKGLIRSLIEKSHRVYVITPPGPFVKDIKQLGARHISLPMERFIAPLHDIRLFFAFYTIFKREKFDLVHTMTIKPVIYGSCAGRLAGIKRVVGLISGIGFVFMKTDSMRLKIIKPVVVQLLRLGFRCCDKVWFQNPDDLEYMVEKKLLPRAKTVLIKGSGVDLEEFAISGIDRNQLRKIKQEFTIEEGNTVVSMIAARLIWSKGVREFLESAKALAQGHPEAKFILLAPFDKGSPDSVTKEYIDKFTSRNISVVTEFRTDAREILAVSDIFVLPSYFKEGLPRVLLEALALEKPIVTTDNAGCREVLEHGKNGYLVPVKNTEKLAEALKKLLEDAPLRKQFGIYSRQKACNEFDDTMVAKRLIRELYEIS